MGIRRRPEERISLCRGLSAEENKHCPGNPGQGRAGWQTPEDSRGHLLRHPQVWRGGDPGPSTRNKEMAGNIPDDPGGAVRAFQNQRAQGIHSRRRGDRAARGFQASRITNP
jgi:hypothetical protein